MSETGSFKNPEKFWPPEPEYGRPAKNAMFTTARQRSMLSVWAAACLNA